MVVKNQAVGNAGLHHNALGCLIEDVTCRCSGFRHHDGTARLQSGDNHCAVRSGFIDAIGGTNRVTFTVPDNKFSVCQRLAGHSVPFRDGQCGLGGVGDNDRLRVSVGADDHVGAGAVHDVTVRGLDFRQYIGAGCEIGNSDFAQGIGSKNAVGGQRGCADHAVQTHFATGRCGDAELRPGERLVGGAVPFLDNELALGLVFHGHADRLTRLDHYRLGLGINEEPRRGLGLCDDHALSGDEALDAHLAIFVRTVNAVGIPNEAAVRVGHLELCIRQRHTGIDTAHLPNEEGAGGLVAELQGLGLVGLDLDRLGHVIQNVPGSGPGLLDHQCGPRHDVGYQDGACAVGGEVAVSVAHNSAVAGGDKELNITQRLAGDAVHLLDQEGPVLAVGEGEGDAVLLLAADVGGLGRGIHDVAVGC